MISSEFFFDDEEEHEYLKLQLRLNRKRLRDQSNPLELDSTYFTKLFRLSKDAFRDLLDEINSKFRKMTRLSSIPNILKLSASLRFFAEGGYQTGTGNDYNIGLAQPTFSKVLTETLNILEDHICSKWIRFDYTDLEKRKAKTYFYAKSGIPGVVGCIDGTHISIIKPNRDLQHLYFNRKGYHSLNAMIVCDHEMVIRYINSKYAGSFHDSTVWNLSGLKGIIHRMYEGGDQSRILADAGYPLHPYIMTPCRAPAANTPQSRYNIGHSKGRNIIERTIGVLKGRFRCLLNARQLHYTPEKATQITNVCAALHNICIQYKVTFNEELALDETVNDGNLNDELGEHSDLLRNEANEIRNRIINLFV